ncbi:tyrosine-type recombinase/integrase [Pelagibacterium halotolerans]|uniref:tyrosine-type recombinase/integrase n=1 Tax=Pelagibacterium halotolerans TaxID=531813 RepID=UPI00384DD0FA
MARSAINDLRYLELHGGKWRVTLGVPKKLRARIGASRLKRSLDTDSLAIANALKWKIIGELKAQLAAAADIVAGNRAAVMKEASQIASAANGYSAHTREHLLQEFLATRVPEILGNPIDVVYETIISSGNGEDEMVEETISRYVYDPEKEKLADDYAAVAAGDQLQIALDDADYKGLRLKVSPRTVDDHDRALGMLSAWCVDNGYGDDMRKVDDVVAAKFVSWMEHQGRAHRTIKKYVSRLNLYFAFLKSKGRPVVNPWRDVYVYTPLEKNNEVERPFTEQEVADLLLGPAKPAMKDLMMIAALTGARLDAIVDLKVEDVIDGKAFRFKPQKRERGERFVPIHRDLVEIVRRRTAGKSPEEEFFPEYPPNSKDPRRERSFAASKQFTTYRKSMGVHEQLPGKRRSRVNFHSWRRWFATKQEWAKVRAGVTASIMGHTRGSITLDVYSEGPDMRLARQAVNKVKLPPLDGSTIVQPQAVTPRR